VVRLRTAPIKELASQYLSHSESFRSQFGRPVEDIDTVAAIAQSSVACGFSSYFDIHLASDSGVIGHIRVDWSLPEEGTLGLHGGSPLVEVGESQHRRRDHASARREAWYLMVHAALASSGVVRVATATSVFNRAAQAFIAESGFRRIRLLHLPDGRETMVHYRILWNWLAPLLAERQYSFSLNGLGLDACRPSLMPLGRQELSVAQAQLPAPPGWQSADEIFAKHHLRNVPTDFLRQLTDASGPYGDREALIQTLYFDAAHGTCFFWLPSTERTVAGVISAKPLPSRLGWWVLRGGIIEPEQVSAHVGPWLDEGFTCQRFQRVEVQVNRTPTNCIDWWKRSGLIDEGVLEINSNGEPIAYCLARVAKD